MVIRGWMTLINGPFRKSVSLFYWNVLDFYGFCYTVVWISSEVPHWLMYCFTVAHLNCSVRIINCCLGYSLWIFCVSVSVAPVLEATTLGQISNTAMKADSTCFGCIMKSRARLQFMWEHSNDWKWRLFTYFLLTSGFSLQVPLTAPSEDRHLNLAH